MADHKETDPYGDTNSFCSLEKEEGDHEDAESPTYEDLHSPMERSTTNQTNRTNRTNRTSHSHAHMEASDLVNLPYRTFIDSTEVEEEYAEEHLGGQVLREVKSHRTGRIERYEFVTWTLNDPENPKNWSKPYKWWCTMMVAITCFVVAFNSAVITADIQGPAKEFHVSEEVSLLAITVFVIGFGVGK